MKKYDHLLRPHTETVIQDAGFWRRAAAFIFDLLLLDLLVTSPFTPVFERMMATIDTTSFTSTAYTSRELGAALLLFIIIYMYFVLFEYTLGQTPGMMLMNTRVNKNNLGRVMVRNSVILPVFPFIIFWFIEPIAIAFWKRGVLERLSDTRTTYQREILL